MTANDRQAAPSQQVAVLALNPSLRQKLLACGLTTTADLEKSITHGGLAQEAHLSLEEAATVQNVLDQQRSRQFTLAGATSARAIFEREAKSRKIITFNSELDAALGGGIATGQVTEFCGQPATGKTQLGIQLAIDVQLPLCFNGLQGKAIYLDTEGSFMVERVAEMAAACLHHLEKIAKHSNSAQKAEAVKQMSTDSMLENIQYVRIRDHVEQVAAVEMLPELLDATPEVKLIVLDSVAFHYRQGFQDMGQRTRILSQMAQQLMQIAADRDIAVFMTNQVTTKVAEDGSSKLVPALGDSWAHAATSRLFLYWQGEQRCAYLYKSPSLPAASVEYFITADGFRGRKPQKRPRPADPNQ